MNPLLAVIRELVEAGGKILEFETQPMFFLRLEQPVFDPLVIRSYVTRHSYFGEERHISLGDECSIPESEQEQDSFFDPEISMTEHGIPITLLYGMKVTSVVTVQHSGNVLVHTNARRLAEGFMVEWAQNIRSQGWLEVAKTHHTCTDVFQSLTE